MKKRMNPRKKFFGARIEFDGNEDHGQIAEYANGRQFEVADIKRIIQFEFRWDILCTLIYRQGNFTRCKEIRFKTPPVRFNDLKPFVDDQATITGLEMPGYKFEKNTWKARVVG